MNTPRVTTIDFETKAIRPRPQYPPVPVGVSILEGWARKPEYLAWGHPTQNNCTLAEAKRRLKQVWTGDVLFHNGKFDYDVGTTHMGVKELAWHQIHDTLFLLFLDDPHARSLSLKPSAERYLGMAPEEQESVRQWLIEQRIVRANDGGWGAHIGDAPGKLVGTYAKGDVIRTKRLFQLLYPKIVAADMLEAYNRERQLMPILLRNEREGLRIDTDLLASDIKAYQSALLATDDWIRKKLRCKELNIDSDPQLAEALDKAGVVNEWSMTPTGKRSTSKANLTPDKFRSKQVAAALGYRNRLSTCLGTFMVPWMAMAEATDRIHTNWNQVRNSDSGKGARSGRLTCNPNFQNLPKDWYDKADGYAHPAHLHVPELPLIRRYAIPDDGKSVFARRDYNQQEFRIVAHFENDKLMRAYQDNPKLDMHAFTNELIEELTGNDFGRRITKIINFGMLYGQGVGSLAEQIGSPVQEVKALRSAQRRALPGVKALDDGIKQAAREGEPIRTLGGRLYHVEPPMKIDGRTVTFEYKLLNYLAQGSAADMTKQAVINYDAARENGRFLVTVHDEINISVPRKYVTQEMKILNLAMADIVIDVPMISDGSYGKNWAECK